LVNSLALSDYGVRKNQNRSIVGAVYDRAFLSNRQIRAVIRLGCALSRLRSADRAYRKQAAAPRLNKERLRRDVVFESDAECAGTLVRYGKCVAE
jgi:hypothetical protein